MYLWLKSKRGFNPIDNYVGCLLGEYKISILHFGMGLKSEAVFYGMYIQCATPHKGLDYERYILLRYTSGQ